MKNTKAIFFIMLGTFLMASGFAFADPTDGPAYKTLENGPWSTLSANSPAVKVNIVPKKDVAATTAPAPQPALTVAPPVPAPTPAPKKLSDQIKKFVGENAEKAVMTGVGAYLGFALFGPAGLLLGALFMFSMDYMGNT